MHTGCTKIEMHACTRNTHSQTHTHNTSVLKCHFRPNNSRKPSLRTDFSWIHTHTHKQWSNSFTLQTRSIKSTLSAWKGSINSQLPSAFSYCTLENAHQPWSIKTHMNTLAPSTHTRTQSYHPGVLSALGLYDLLVQWWTVKMLVLRVSTAAGGSKHRSKAPCYIVHLFSLGSSPQIYQHWVKHTPTRPPLLATVCNLLFFFISF